MLIIMIFMPRTTAVGIGSKKAWRPVTHNSRVFGKLRATRNSYFPKGTRRCLLIYNGLDITLPSSFEFRYLFCGWSKKICKNWKMEAWLGRPVNDSKQNETIKENGQLMETKQILTIVHANTSCSLLIMIEFRWQNKRNDIIQEWIILQKKMAPQSNKTREVLYATITLMACIERREQ